MCRQLGVHHSTYYCWRRKLVRFGPELLRPRERCQPRMPNAIPPTVEQRILALALAYPGWGPDRLSLELGREKWGGQEVSANGIWRALKQYGLNTRAKRLSLVCGYAAPPQPERPEPPPERHIEAKHPGHRVQFDRSSGRERIELVVMGATDPDAVRRARPDLQPIGHAQDTYLFLRRRP